MAAITQKQRLKEAEECLLRASQAMLNACTELEWGDPWYSEVCALADDVHAMRRALTDSIRKKTNQKKARK